MRRTFRVIYKPTGELVLDAAARYRGIDRRFKLARRLFFHDVQSIDEEIKKRQPVSR